MLVSRRRFIAISAAAGGLPLLPIAPARAAPLLRVWTGTALGCDAILQIHYPDPATADRLIEASLAEVRRLECIISFTDRTALFVGSTATESSRAAV